MWWRLGEVLMDIILSSVINDSTMTTFFAAIQLNIELMIPGEICEEHWFLEF